MTLYELLSFNRNIVSALHTMGVGSKDYEYMGFYAEYVELRRKGEKVTWIAATLSERYGISEREFYNIIRRYKTNCTECAVLFEPVICLR